MFCARHQRYLRLLFALTELTRYDEDIARMSLPRIPYEGVRVESSVDDNIVNNSKGSVGKPQKQDTVDLPTDNFFELALSLGLEEMILFSWCSKPIALKRVIFDCVKPFEKKQVFANMQCTFLVNLLGDRNSCSAQTPEQDEHSLQSAQLNW